MLAPNIPSPGPLGVGPGPVPGGGGDSLSPPPVPVLHDVTVVRKRTTKCARVEAVPPEEFGIAKNARTIKGSDYCYHAVIKSVHHLINAGYDAAQLKDIPSYTEIDNNESISRNSVDERLFTADVSNEMAREIRIVEHYIVMDYNDNDKPALYRVTTAGDDSEILTRDGDEDIHQVDMMPFAAMTPVIITHRFFGRSIADLVMDIQRIKTALLRAMLDDAYLANNRRTEVSEVNASVNTLDDLLVSRPGGIVRTKTPGGLREIEHTPISTQVMPLLEYMDATREARSGVSRVGQGLDPNTLQNQSATATNQVFTAVQARMKLIARIFAETGIRDLFALLHAVIRKNGNEAATVRLRNQWVNVNPREWRRRDDMTINVGLGTGGKAEQLIHLTSIIGAQEKAVLGGLPIVSVKNFYNSAEQLCRLSGFKDAGRFFLDPSAPPNPQDPQSQPIQKPPDPKAMAEQMKADLANQAAQHKAALDQQGAAIDQQHQIAKAQAEAALAREKHQLDLQKAEIDTALKIHEHQAAMEQQTREHHMEMMRMRQEHAIALDQHHMSMAQQVAKGDGKSEGKPADHTPHLIHALTVIAAPKKIVYGPDGKPSHTEALMPKE